MDLKRSNGRPSLEPCNVCEPLVYDHSETSYDWMIASTNQEVKSLRRASFALYEMHACEGDFSDTTSYLETDDDASLFGSVSSIEWDCEWGEVDSLFGGVQIKAKRTTAVRFSCIEVREFALTIGETQTLDEYDCPLELSWTHAPTDTVLPLPLSVGTSRMPRRLSLRERQLRLVESQRYAAQWRTEISTT